MLHVPSRYMLNMNSYWHMHAEFSVYGHVTALNVISVIDQCAGVQCENGGTCHDDVMGGFECRCAAGFTGSLCEIGK